MEIGHLDGLVMLLRILEEGDQSPALKLGSDVVERNAVVFVVRISHIGLSVAGNTRELMEMFTAFLSESQVRGNRGGFPRGQGCEIGSDVGGSLGTFRLGVIDHGGHGGSGLELLRLGNPAGKPDFVSTVTNIGEIGSGVFQLGHGGFAKVGGVALDTIVAGEEVGWVEGDFFG